MGGMTLGACASGIAGYGGTAGHCPPLAPSARYGASPHHARGPLVSTSAAAARCLPLLPLPAAASRVASATSPRASPEYAAAAWRVAKATSRGGGGGGGEPKTEGAKEVTPVAHTCPAAAPLNTSLHPLYPLPSHPSLGHTPSTVPTVSLLPPPPPPTHTHTPPPTHTLPAAGIPPRNAPPPLAPPAPPAPPSTFQRPDTRRRREMQTVAVLRSAGKSAPPCPPTVYVPHPIPTSCCIPTAPSPRPPSASGHVTCTPK